MTQKMHVYDPMIDFACAKQRKRVRRRKQRNYHRFPSESMIRLWQTTSRRWRRSLLSPIQHSGRDAERALSAEIGTEPVAE